MWGDALHVLLGHVYKRTELSHSPWTSWYLRSIQTYIDHFRLQLFPTPPPTLPQPSPPTTPSLTVTPHNKRPPKTAVFSTTAGWWNSRLALRSQTERSQRESDFVSRCRLTHGETNINNKSKCWQDLYSPYLRIHLQSSPVHNQSLRMFGILHVILQQNECIRASFLANPVALNDGKDHSYSYENVDFSHVYDHT